MEELGQLTLESHLSKEGRVDMQRQERDWRLRGLYGMIIGSTVKRKDCSCCY